MLKAMAETSVIYATHGGVPTAFKKPRGLDNAIWISCEVSGS